VKPQIAPSMFPAAKASSPDVPQRSNTSKRRAEPTKAIRKRSNTSDDFGDDGIDDEELVRAMHDDPDFEHIDNFPNPTDAIARKNTVKNKLTAKAKNQSKTGNTSTDDDTQEPLQLSNGKWACKHACKDKNACKHLCCKEGMDKPPKKPAVAKHATLGDDHHAAKVSASSQTPKVMQTKLQLTSYKRKLSSAVEELDLTQEEKKQKTNLGKNGPKDYRELHQLHRTIQKKDPPSALHSVMHTKPSYCYSEGGEHSLSFLEQARASQSEDLSDYGDIPLDGLSTHFDMPDPEPVSLQRAPEERENSTEYAVVAPVASCASETFGDDDSLLGDAMMGLADSQILREMNDGSPQSNDFKPAKLLLQDSDLMELKQPKTNSTPLRRAPSETPTEDNTRVIDVLDMLDDLPAREASPVTGAFQGLEPWLFQEFGDIVELVAE
jgi:ATP-dependent DNA helicase HFM1/MER3